MDKQKYYITPEYLDARLDEFAEMIGRAVGELVMPKIDALEQSKIGVRDVGTWTAGRSYAEGDVTTHRGSMWTALHDFPGKPGGGPPSGWRLSANAKGGRGRK